MMRSQAFAFGIVESGGRLVHQQEARPHGDGAADADAALVAEGERAGRPRGVRAEIEPIQNFQGARAGSRPGETPAASAPASMFSRPKGRLNSSTF